MATLAHPMIDLHAFRADPDLFRAAWTNRGASVDVDGLLAKDQQVRELKTHAEQMKADANRASKAIGAAAKAGEDINAAKAEAKRLGDEVRTIDSQRQEAEEDLHRALLELPNPCLPEVPIGPDESANVVVESWGTPPAFDFGPKPHWDLAGPLGLIDFERGARLSGSGFVAYTGMGARLVRALVHFFLSELTDEHGYEEIMPPVLVRPEIMQGTGQLPKFADQAYHCAGDDLYLIPTAEVPVTNLYRDEIFAADQLPKRFTAYTPCFRREAGAAGVGTRGITRMHQFDKVEMVWLSTPERSGQDLLTLRSHAEGLLRKLELPYRVLELCTGDTGFSSAHTYDLEVWSPGTDGWLEVSSCSTFTDFQARRCGLRYRPASEDGGKAKAQPLHTLNGSGLAVPRTLIAILENYQQADGSVRVPEPLQPFMGTDIIRP